MQRVQEMIHQSKKIVLVDLSACLPEETIQVVDAAKKIIARYPSKSCLVLTDVKGARYNSQVAEKIKEFTSHNTPYVKASAVVGADGVAGILLQTVIFLTRRELKAFNQRDEALNWLTNAH